MMASEPQMQATSRSLLGGVSEPALANAECQAMIDKVKGDVEKKLDRKLSVYKATQYCSQVVNGCKYFVKIDVGNDEFIHLHLYQAIDGDLSITNVDQKMKESDPIKK